MPNRLIRALVLQVLLVTPAALRAQSGAYFEALSTPPLDVGSCTRAPAETDTFRLQRHLLVMTSPQPGRRRTMSAFVGESGVTSYHEMAMGTTGTVNSTSTSFFATFNADGMLFGYKSKTQVAFPDSILSDPQGFLNGKYQQSITSAREPLTDSEQRSIRDLIAFLRKRCPE